MIKYFEEPFKNVECLQNDTLYLKLEVVSKIFIFSIQPVKLAKAFRNNAEISSEKTFEDHRTITNLSFKKSHFVKKSVLETYHQANSKYSETVGIHCTSNALFVI